MEDKRRGSIAWRMAPHDGSWLDYEGSLHSISSMDMDIEGSDILDEEITS